MARPSLPLIQALRTTARRLEAATGLKAYQWGHMGSCNCGHLAQVVTKLDKAEIHQRALQTRHGDWDDQLNDYCPHSGLPLDDVIDEILAFGFSRADLAHLERLSDPAIRAALPIETRQRLQYNSRADVVLYLRTWADQLETQLLADVPVRPEALVAVEMPAPVVVIA